MILILCGEDTYRSKKRLADLKEKFLLKYGNLNLIEFTKENWDFEKFKDSIFSEPFLSEKKLIICKEILSKEKIKELFDLVPENVILIFWEKECPSFELNKKIKLEKFDLLNDLSLKNWIKNEIRIRKSKITETAIEKLISYIGNDLWQLSNEIDKLIAFTKGNTITSKEVDLLVRAKLSANIFSLLDALAEKDLKKAIKIYHNFLKLGEDVLYLFNMIIYQFKNLLLIKDVQISKTSFKNLELHPYVLKKSLSLAKNFTLEELKKIYQLLLETDIEIKTGKKEPDLALDLLITEICTLPSLPNSHQ